jgi:nicotinamide riboside kinase
VWCEFVFGRCHQWIIDQIATRQYDLYFLCNTDLPWVEDELREYPQLEMREKLFRMYKDILVNQLTPWIEITGGPGQRLEKALSAVGEILR